MKHANEKDYKKVKHYCKHDWEKQALKKLFHKESTVKKLLKKLVHSEKPEEGASKNEDLPKELKAPPSKTVSEQMDDLIKNLEEAAITELAPAETENNSDYVITSEPISKEEILKNASGGIALEGCFENDGLEELTIKREQLLQVPNNLSLSQPQQDEKIEQFQVTSIEEEEEFMKAVEKMGFSLACSANAGILNMGLNACTKGKTSSGYEKENPKKVVETYASTLKYCYVPTASCLIDEDQMHLSDSALNVLKSIENMKSSDKTEKFLEFFKKFGTHANQGPIHFGGIFWWKASCQGFAINEITEVKEWTETALGAHFGAGKIFPFLDTSVGLELEHSRPVGTLCQEGYRKGEQSIQFCISKTGGLSSTDNFLQWKQGLRDNNATWAVIDREKQLVPVWKIILKNHSSEFKDSVVLAKEMEKTYCKYTGNVPVLNTQEEEMCALLEDVSSWDCKNAEEHLIKILESKLLENNVEVIIENENFQLFLSNLISTSNCRNDPKMKFLVQSLMDQCDPASTFPNTLELKEWICQNDPETDVEISLTNLADFLKLLEQSKSEMMLPTFQTSAISLRYLKEKNTRLITTAHNCLCRHLQSLQMPDEGLLLLTVSQTVGYDPKNEIFTHLLGLTDVEKFQKTLSSTSEHYLKLKEECPIKAQVFVIQQALKLIPKSSSYEKNQQLECIKHSI